MKKVLIVDDVKGWRDYNSNIVYEILGDDVFVDTAECATEAYNKLFENNSSPYDIVITDLQMEDDYAPKYAGEWLVEQVKTFSAYKKTKIIMVSASYNIRQIAEGLGVSCIPKSTALKSFSVYEEVLK